jgi:hypothetical protein
VQIKETASDRFANFSPFLFAIIERIMAIGPVINTNRNIANAPNTIPKIEKILPSVEFDIISPFLY